VAKDKDRNVIIVDRSAPRVAIQITEIAVDAKKKTRRRQSVAHLTVTNLSGEEAKRIIIKAIEKVSRSVDEELLANSPSSQEICRPIRYPSVHGRDNRQVRPTRKSEMLSDMVWPVSLNDGLTALSLRRSRQPERKYWRGCSPAKGGP